MRLSSLVVAVVLLVSPVLFAQHSSGGGSSSGGSSGSSSSGASHGGSSGGSGSGSHASSGHSSGGSTSSGSHGSGGSVSRGSSKGTTSSTAQPSRSGRAEEIREPKRTGVQNHMTAKPSKNPQREHRGIFFFLRRRRHEPKPYVPPTEVDLRRPACPPGHSAGKKGGCIANATTTNVSTPCPANGNGVSCTNNADRCASVREQLDAAAAELRSIRAEMQNGGCSGMSPAQECSFLAQRRDAAVARYRALQSGAGPNCAGTLVDPLSL
jgi:hypothetical protein